MIFWTILLAFLLNACEPQKSELSRERNSNVTPTEKTDPETPSGPGQPSNPVSPGDDPSDPGTGGQTTAPDIGLRSSHPRLFITSEDIPTLKANAAGDCKAAFEGMKARAMYYGTNGVTFADPLAKSGEYNSNHEIGFRAVEAALCWLVTEDTRYLDYTKRILDDLLPYYELRVANNLNIAWYIYSTVCTVVAYDWICKDLTAADREKYGKRLYDVAYNIAWHGGGIRTARYRENISDSQSGCYGPSVLPWYLGLAFYGDGINDEQCAKMIETGRRYYESMAEFRGRMAGQKGGGASGCVVYCFGYYPIADFSYIYTNRSAFGKDISGQMAYVMNYLDYLDWQRLPGNTEFGFGDTNHYKYGLPATDINYHIAAISDIFGSSHPEILSKAARMLEAYDKGLATERLPFSRFLIKVKPGTASAPSQSTQAIYFDTMGQVVMRSGTGDDDTYAMFVSGGVPTQHKHYDNNHFILYKHGWRALDSGSRPEPGQHLSHYYSRTVAHNCITVRMPGESFPKYWGELASGETSLAVPNDGGQCELLASSLEKMQETSDYVYLASDATGSYSSSKVNQVVREFIWCKPDVFVIFDRVVSKNASYPKKWLYHLASEPVISGAEFSETSQGGKSICRTLFPKDAVIEKIGGPGKQFWSDGRNWPIPADRGGAIPPDDWPLVGQWRIEVSPGKAALADNFMHIIQVGSESLSSLPATETFDDGSKMGVSFNYSGKSFTLTFDKNPSAGYGCTIKVE